MEPFHLLLAADETRIVRPQGAQDAIPPIVHGVDFAYVEEATQFLARELPVVFLDLLDQFRNATLLVVFSRVAQEKIVRYDSTLPFDEESHFQPVLTFHV